MTTQQAFALALQHHQAGRLREAEAIYREILLAEPQQADALHLLGVLAHQTGRHDLAVERIRHALALHPDNPIAHSNLGEAHRALGQFDLAIACYHRALQLQPDLVEMHSNLGLALAGQSRFEEAVAAHRQAVQLRPDNAVAYYNLGTALAQQNRLEQAVTAYRRALQLRPDYAAALNNLGLALAAQGQFDEAVAVSRQLLQLQPGSAEAHNNLGLALRRQGRFGEAIAAYRRALELQPGHALAHYNLGATFMDQGQLDEAVAAFRRALDLQPDFAEAHDNLGNVLARQGQFDEATTAFQRALQLQPNLGRARFNLSLLLLRSGDYERGWPLYEARWDTFQNNRRQFSLPQWDGSALDGRRILIHAEQGFGDALQFIRYARFAAERGGEVIVECPRSLVALFRSAQGVRAVVAAGEPLPPFDVHLPMLSQPWVLQMAAQGIPQDVPYLFADPARREIWRGRIGHPPARWKVGLAWAGDPIHSRDRIRSLGLHPLLPLLALQGHEFFSVQTGRGTADIAQTPGAERIIDHTESIQDFADTAAFLMELDLIISIDSAVAHLAGALGRPVWTLLPFVSDWRWGLESEKTPWYPSMRLFRQPVAGDWDAVLHRVCDELNQATTASLSPQ